MISLAAHRARIAELDTAHDLNEKVSFSADHHAATDTYVVVRVDFEPEGRPISAPMVIVTSPGVPQTWLARSPIGPAAEPDPGSSTTPAAEANTRAWSVECQGPCRRSDVRGCW